MGLLVLGGVFSHFALGVVNGKQIPAFKKLVVDLAQPL